MRKHFAKWHPGQEVELRLQPLYYDVHTPDATQRHLARRALNRDANTIQVSTYCACHTRDVVLVQSNRNADRERRERNSAKGGGGERETHLTPN